MKLIAVVAVVLALSQRVLTENSTFVATNEWQEIKDGQSIPKGLYVRINLQTGKKEARLLNESEMGENLDMPDDDDASSSSRENSEQQTHFKSALTLSEDVVKSLPLEYKPDKSNLKSRKYNSYKELKDAYSDMRKNFKTDGEIITHLIAQYREMVKSEEEAHHREKAQSQLSSMLNVLENLNNLVHQIDNAQWFVDAGGLEHVLQPIVVNETHIGLRVQAMRVLGALTQNNPKTQVEVFRRNFGSHLAQILISSSNTEELSTALYAFGALLRKFPHAQERILSTSGTQALIAVLAKECELRLKAKAVTFISDVIVEKELVLSDTSDNKDQLSAAQYAELNFPEWLRSNAYCDTMDTLVSANLYPFLEQPDTVEYFTDALKNTAAICMDQWTQSPQLRHTLLTINNRYMRSTENYRQEVALEIRRVIEILYPDAATHDEL